MSFSYGEHSGVITLAELNEFVANHGLQPEGTQIFMETEVTDETWAPGRTKVPCHRFRVEVDRFGELRAIVLELGESPVVSE